MPTVFGAAVGGELDPPVRNIVGGGDSHREWIQKVVQCVKSLDRYYNV